ncbi:MAG: hypothetical protein HOO06_09645 [Bdellovibrionaceae bacterium]|jgi:hypothetical protein|nr:hypothetical protein [Pseudobdellovibrionaceae bacterium]
MKKIIVLISFLATNAMFAADLTCATPYEIMRGAVVASLNQLGDERNTDEQDALANQVHALLGSNMEFAQEFNRVNMRLEQMVTNNIELDVEAKMSMLIGSFYMTCE